MTFVAFLRVFRDFAKCCNYVRNIYALTLAIKFNSNKTVGMLFPSPTLKLNFQPNINLDGCAIRFVSDVKYLGVYLNQHGKDDADINRQVRYLYCTANTVKSQFHICSEPVKNVFRIYCMSMYSAHLWCDYLKSSYNKIRVAYNNAFHVLHGIPKYVSARLGQIYANIPTFDAYIRNCLYGFY